MYKLVTLEMFRKEIKQANLKEFSDEGLEALFDHLEFLESGVDMLRLLNVTKICKNFTEYKGFNEFAAAVNFKLETLKKIRKSAINIKDTGRFIIQTI